MMIAGGIPRRHMTLASQLAGGLPCRLRSAGNTAHPLTRHENNDSIINSRADKLELGQ
jgi:hypothetical protein